MTETRIALTARLPRLIAGTAACMLLAAAAFKGYALIYGVTVAEAVVTAPPAQFALIQGELFLALWLLSGWRLRLALQTAALVFAVFALTSLYLAWQGRASCGCFGTLSINPWLMFAVDAAAAVSAALAARMAARRVSEGDPRGDEFQITSAGDSHLASARNSLAHASGCRPASPLLVSLAGALMLLSIAYAALALAGHEPTDLLARWRGDFLRVNPAEIDLGAGPAGESLTTKVTLSNVGTQPMEIVGGSTDCQCITTQELPITLRPGESRAIQVSIRRTGSPGVQRRRYHFYTNLQQQFRAHATFVGQVTASPLSAETKLNTASFSLSVSRPSTP